MGQNFNITKKTTTTSVLAKGAVTKISGTLASSALDDTNTNKTSVIRAGKPLGVITASGKYKECDHGLSDGSETFVGINAHEVNLLDENGTAQDMQIDIIESGLLNQDYIVSIADANFVVATAKTDAPQLIWLTPTARHFEGGRIS